MAYRRKVNVARGQLVGVLNDVLSEFVDEEKKTINEVYRSVANETEKMVSGNSPKDSGDYAEGWKVVAKTKSDSFGETISYVVGNPEHYQLTHLLEKGHAVKNQ
ncbi:MAG: HK97 gp10 family phage protein, partial [Bacteroidales bacterium]|nr:HK97 gp10 family phage protein [Bacteroidales bacterium]